MSESIPWKDQYKHPLWQKKRLARLEIANWKCECCDSEEKQLHVHHKAYRKGALIWEYTDDELEVLCEGCHERAHQLKDLLNGAIFDLDSASLERVIGYAQGLAACWHPSAEICVISYEHAAGVGEAHGLSAEDVISAVNESHIITEGELLSISLKKIKDRHECEGK